MWKLDQPSIQELDDYEQMLMTDLYNRILGCGDSSIVDALVPQIPTGGRDKSILKILLRGSVYDSYTESERRMGKIFSGYRRADLNDYFKALHTKKGRRSSLQLTLLSKYQTKMETLAKVMGYEEVFGDRKMAYAVTEWKGAKVCTYCNRDYIFTISTGKRKKDKIARPELDHWYPKSKYPLLALNYYNLIPSCSICNSSVKGNADFDVTTHIHPYLQKKFNPGFKFRYTPTAPQWEQVTLDVQQVTQRELTMLDAFKIKEVYNCHADLEAKELYELTQRHGARYVKDLLKLLGDDYGKSEQEVYRMVFGTELDARYFGNRPMSKFKHDLLEQMMVLKNGHYLRR